MATRAGEAQQPLFQAVTESRDQACGGQAALAGELAGTAKTNRAQHVLGPGPAPFFLLTTDQ